MNRFVQSLFLIVLAFGNTFCDESALAEQVKIIRDDFGIPHIFADTDEAAAYGFGYAQAEDRLEQLLQNYRTAE